MHNSITIFLFVAERYNMGDKAILVTRDPVFVNKNVINGRYIGVRPHTYLPLAIAVTICIHISIVYMNHVDGGKFRILFLKI
jgi:hypothetical protein